MCNTMLTTKCPKSTTKINECSQLSSNHFTSKCFCTDDNNNQISFSEKISVMLKSINVRVISKNCRFNCYDYQRICNEKCITSGNINDYLTNRNPIINFCNYKYKGL